MELKALQSDSIETFLLHFVDERRQTSAHPCNSTSPFLDQH